jgi:hypothetical protein
MRSDTFLERLHGVGPGDLTPSVFLLICSPLQQNRHITNDFRVRIVVRNNFVVTDSNLGYHSVGYPQ